MEDGREKMHTLGVSLLLVRKQSPASLISDRPAVPFFHLPSALFHLRYRSRSPVVLWSRRPAAALCAYRLALRAPVVPSSPDTSSGQSVSERDLSFQICAIHCWYEERCGADPDSRDLARQQRLRLVRWQ